ncbi:MAG: type II secretion system protein J [Candidatus Glassbacteria bacterium]
MITETGDTGRGFTLIEILLSVSILAIAAGIIYGSLRTGLESSRRAEANSELFQRVRIIREIISSDLANAFVPKRSHGFLGDLEEFEGELFSDEGGEFDLSTGFPNAFDGKDEEIGGVPLDRMEFYTISKGTFENDMPVYVSYYIDDDPLSDEEGLVMERIATILPAESFRKELASEVVGMDVKYLESTPEGQLWVDGWQDKRKLPRAVEVTLIWDEQIQRRLQYAKVPILISISATHVF